MLGGLDLLVSYAQDNSSGYSMSRLKRGQEVSYTPTTNMCPFPCPSTDAGAPFFFALLTAFFAVSPPGIHAQPQGPIPSPSNTDGFGDDGISESDMRYLLIGSGLSLLPACAFTVAVQLLMPKSCLTAVFFGLVVLSLFYLGCTEDRKPCAQDADVERQDGTSSEPQGKGDLERVRAPAPPQQAHIKEEIAADVNEPELGRDEMEPPPPPYYPVSHLFFRGENEVLTSSIADPIVLRKPVLKASPSAYISAREGSHHAELNYGNTSLG